jgi:hypothetical protein
MIKKAVRVGWAMTGGQDRAAAVRRIALAAAVRSKHVRDAMASTATPRLKAGARQPAPRLRPSGIPAALRPGGLIPNPLVSVGTGPPARLDAVLAGRAAVLTARPPDPALIGFCRRHGLALIRISSAPGTRRAGTRRPGTRRPGWSESQQDGGWTDVRLTSDGQPGGLGTLAARPALAVIVRPDRVIAAAATSGQPPRLPWSVPAVVARGPAPAPRQQGNPDFAGPLPAAF